MGMHFHILIIAGRVAVVIINNTDVIIVLIKVLKIAGIQLGRRVIIGCSAKPKTKQKIVNKC